nr:deoxyribonuclease-1-like isoform X1 [Anas platyrhynchos]
MAALKLLLPLLAAALLLHGAAALRISAFNIRAFGDSKMSNQTIADFIVSILSEYDLTVVQEVRDADLSSVRNLVAQLNSASPYPYSFLDSIPLGRNSYKEQYVYIYRTDILSVLGSYYYDDGCEPCGTDVFSREPFIVKFSSPTTQLAEFVVAPLHAEPSSAPDEIDALADVYTDVINKWATDNVLFLGDFNADCSYVTASQWPSIRLRNLQACEWLIPDSADTTVGSTNCAYDRWVPWRWAWGAPGGTPARADPHGASAASLPVAPRCARLLNPAPPLSTTSRRISASRTRMLWPSVTISLWR